MHYGCYVFIDPAVEEKDRQEYVYQVLQEFDEADEEYFEYVPIDQHLLRVLAVEYSLDTFHEVEKFLPMFDDYYKIHDGLVCEYTNPKARYDYFTPFRKFIPIIGSDEDVGSCIASQLKEPYMIPFAMVTSDGRWFQKREFWHDPKEEDAVMYEAFFRYYVDHHQNEIIVACDMHI